MLKEKKFDLATYLNKYASQVEINVVEDVDNDDIEIWNNEIERCGIEEKRLQEIGEEIEETPNKTIFKNNARNQTNATKKNKRKFSFSNKTAESVSDEEITGLENAFCLGPGVWLDDKHIQPALNMMKTQFPAIGGLIDTILFQQTEIHLHLKEINVFIVLVTNNHWVNTLIK